MAELNYPSLASMLVGSALTRPLLIRGIEQETAKNNKPYVRFTVMDGFSIIEGVKMFNTSTADIEALGIGVNSIVDADISADEFNSRKTYHFTGIRPAADTELKLTDFIRHPPVEPEVMFDEITELLKSAVSESAAGFTPLSELALDILNDKKERFMKSTASVTMHHNMRGGLIYHTYRMIKSADALCGIYTALDRELLLSGVALHDIGKMWEYDTSPYGESTFTTSGTLLGHMYIGASLIKQYTAKKNYDPEKVKLLIHLILSHHGMREWGAVTLPSVPEAFMLHYIDNIDAKIYACEDVYETLADGTMTEKKVFGLDTRIYKPKQSE